MQPYYKHDTPSGVSPINLSFTPGFSFEVSTTRVNLGNRFNGLQVMQLTPSDIYLHFKPSECDLRVYLHEQRVEAAEPSPYSEVLKRLGRRHEKQHLESLGQFEDLRACEDVEPTKAAVAAGGPVIYQPLLKCTLRLAGIDCEVSGRPDFLIRDELGYRIRDSKISRRITQDAHPEIILQLQTYGWLFERVFGFPASGLEVHNGPGEIVEVAYAGPEPVIDALRKIVTIRSLKEEPFAPVGFSRCRDCGYHDRCWNIAEGNRSVALVNGVDKGLAFALHDLNLHTMDQLLEQFDDEKLGALKRTRGEKLVRVGEAASSILRNAKALASGEEILLRKPEIPESKNYVMFDLEGLPPQFDELQLLGARTSSSAMSEANISGNEPVTDDGTNATKAYLWGMQVFGETPSDYISSTAGFGVDGDREGWEEFLTRAAAIFDAYGDIPFVHWATYEATLINLYIKRFGDDTGRAARVQRNRLNLLPITEASIVLPLPSYSLNQVSIACGSGRVFCTERARRRGTGQWQSTLKPPRPKTRPREKKLWTPSAPTTAKISQQLGQSYAVAYALPLQAGRAILTSDLDSFLILGIGVIREFCNAFEFLIVLPER